MSLVARRARISDYSPCDALWSNSNTFGTFCANRPNTSAGSVSLLKGTRLTYSCGLRLRLDSGFGQPVRATEETLSTTAEAYRTYDGNTSITWSETPGPKQGNFRVFLWPAAEFGEKMSFKRCLAGRQAGNRPES